MMFSEYLVSQIKTPQSSVRPLTAALDERFEQLFSSRSGSDPLCLSMVCTSNESQGD